MAASTCTTLMRNGSSSATASVRRSSFFRQLDPEVRQERDGAGEEDEAGVDQALVLALAHRMRERAAEQDERGGDEAEADHDHGREDDHALPDRGRREHGETVAGCLEGPRGYPEPMPRCGGVIV